MDINNLTIAQIKEIAVVAACISGNAPATQMQSCCDQKRRKVIVRSRDAGVLYGTFEKLEGHNVTLSNARQLWKWKTKQGISLIDLASYGAVKSGCNFSKAQGQVVVLNACAIIDVEDSAQASIEEV